MSGLGDSNQVNGAPDLFEGGWRDGVQPVHSGWPHLPIFWERNKKDLSDRSCPATGPDRNHQKTVGI